MRYLSVWLVEFIKLMGGQRLHPLRTQCPICGQRVELHVNKAMARANRLAGLRSETAISAMLSSLISELLG